MNSTQHIEFSRIFLALAVKQSGPAGRMAGLPVLKKGGKIQTVVSCSDFEIILLFFNLDFIIFEDFFLAFLPLLLLSVLTEISIMVESS